MRVYIYQADIYSEEAGEAIRTFLASRGKAPLDPANESTYDSADYPKGPYPDGGGEADTPQHCADTGLFLENPLTEDGSAHVKQAFKRYSPHGGNRAVLASWQAFYAEEYGEAIEENEREGLPAIVDFIAEGNGAE